MTRRSPLVGVTGLVLLLGAPAAHGRPIRTNTPGTGVFIGSGVLLQGVCDERSSEGGEVSGCQLVADFRYTPATHWVLGVRAPLYVEREIELEGGLDGRELSESGFGDVEASAKWRFFREVGPWFDRHAAVEVGVALPTGASDLPDDPEIPLSLAHRLGPGDGSTDAFIDLVFQQGQRRFVWGADLLYRRNGEGEREYDFGDVVRLAVDAEYVLFPRVYRQPGNEVFVLLETFLVHRGDDEAAGRELPTGGTELLLAPGIQYVATERMLVSLSLQLPAWSDVDGLETDWDVLAELRYAF